jgi:hypothetical protein
LPEVVAGIGVAGCAIAALALVARRPSLFPLGLAGVGAAYGVYVSLRGRGVDPLAPLVAAALYAAAEVGFWSLERTAARGERALTARRLGGLAAGALLTALVGSLLLLAASGTSGGVGLEAAGVAAAIVALAAIARLARSV